MTSLTVDHLYALLPAIYRIRDAENGEPLRGLLSVIAEQANLVREDIGRLYDNWFIETCDEWVVPYLGDLLGVRDLYPVSGGAALSQRSRIGNTIGYRRRKGTASMLEQLARDTTGWPVRVVEFFQLLATTQHVNHVRLSHPSTLDLRQMTALEQLGGPFEGLAHTLDVRHVDNQRGKHNIRHLGIFLWRLQAFPIVEAAPFAHGDGRFSFSPLGQSMPLFQRPRDRDDALARTTEFDVPSPLSRRGFAARLTQTDGAERSLWISVRDPGGTEAEPLEVVASNLADWSHRPPAREPPVDGDTADRDVPVVPRRPRQVAVDPELGRFAFAEGESPPPDHVRVNYQYGFSAELGGGGYVRAASGLRTSVVAQASGAASPDVPTFSSLREALAHHAVAGVKDHIIEITDSGLYVEAELPELRLRAGTSLTLRAASRARPVLQLGTLLSIRGEPHAPGEAGARLTIAGLLIAGAGLRVEEGGLGRLDLEHCTLVPGGALSESGAPVTPGQISLDVDGNDELVVTLNRSISGRLDVPSTAALHVTDSIIDGAQAGALEDEPVAIRTGRLAIRTGRLAIEASTVFGTTSAVLIDSASNVIFTGRVEAQRSQAGCVRFCFVPPGSEVPRRYRCQPDGANALHPQFTELYYGQPGYAQLSLQCPPEIRAGADDEGEMGAFHHLKQAQREANLRASFAEYLRVGLEAGLIYVT
jgi:hypothetical protein